MVFLFKGRVPPGHLPETLYNAWHLKHPMLLLVCLVVTEHPLPNTNKAAGGSCLDMVMGRLCIWGTHTSMTRSFSKTRQAFPRPMTKEDEEGGRGRGSVRCGHVHVRLRVSAL